MGEPIVAWASVLHVVNATEHPVVEVVVAGTDPIATEGAVIFTSTALAPTSAVWSSSSPDRL